MIRVKDWEMQAQAHEGRGKDRVNGGEKMITLAVQLL